MGAVKEESNQIPLRKTMWLITEKMEVGRWGGGSEIRKQSGTVEKDDVVNY